MGNVIGSLLSGFGEVISKLFGSPLDFLAGKSCSTSCGPTWDLICYIENFCIAHLLKLAMVSVLFYFVLLFLYLLYKLGICECVCRTLCRFVWAFFATCFSTVEYCCTFLCYKLPKLKRIHRRHKRDIIAQFYPSSTDEEGSFSHHHVPRRHGAERRSLPRQWKDNRGSDHLRRSLRPRSHRIHVGIRGDSAGYVSKRKSFKKHGHQHGTTVQDDIRVTQTSKFAQKSGNRRGSTHHRTRRK